MKYLERGHAIQFRCQHPEALGMRVVIMSKMCGVEPFSKLWPSRTTIKLPDGSRCDLLSLPDLVQAKKTQRDKDWPMIRRLLESHYFQNREKPTIVQDSDTPKELAGRETLERALAAIVSTVGSMPGDETPAPFHCLLKFVYQTLLGSNRPERERFFLVKN